MTGSDREARLLYGPAIFEQLSPGRYVVCAVTGRRIDIEDLRYWSVARQEPYGDPAAMLLAVGRATADD